jgi:hypothetical protein
VAVFEVTFCGLGGMRWRSWLRHCATSRKATSSIPDGLIGIFHRHNPSGHTMALGLTQPLTKMSTRNISWGQRRPVHRADNLTTFMCLLSWNLETSNSWKPHGLSKPVMGLLYLLGFDLCYWHCDFLYTTTCRTNNYNIKRFNLPETWRSVNFKLNADLVEELATLNFKIY